MCVANTHLDDEVINFLDSEKVPALSLGGIVQVNGSHAYGEIVTTNSAALTAVIERSRSRIGGRNPAGQVGKNDCRGDICRKETLRRRASAFCVPVLQQIYFSRLEIRMASYGAPQFSVDLPKSAMVSTPS